MAYELGNRRAELVNLRVNQLDFLNRILRLNPGETKNDDGRVAAMSQEMYP
jgi:integrase